MDEDLFGTVADGERLKREGMVRVAKPLTEAHRERILMAVHDCAVAVPEFTTDRVEWLMVKRMIGRPANPKAYGPIMRAVAKLGWIEATERSVKSVIPRNHRRPKAVWRSLIHQKEPTR
jgi:hypothetical protein